MSPSLSNKSNTIVNYKSSLGNKRGEERRNLLLWQELPSQSHPPLSASFYQAAIVIIILNIFIIVINNIIISPTVAFYQSPSTMQCSTMHLVGAMQLQSYIGRRGSLKSINIWGDTKCQAYLAPAFLELVHSPNQLFCIYIETCYPWSRHSPESYGILPFFSSWLMRRYRSHVSEWVTERTLGLTLLMWPWWVRIPIEDFTDATWWLWWA